MYIERQARQEIHKLITKYIKYCFLFYDLGNEYYILDLFTAWNQQFVYIYKMGFEKNVNILRKQ